MSIVRRRPAAASLLAQTIGDARAEPLARAVFWPDALTAASTARIDRGSLAWTLALLLLEDLSRRVPLAAAYLAECVAAGRAFVFDHGAVRTIAGASRAQLPSGRRAITRVLEALGYREAARYPLPGIGMTGYAYTHVDHPEDIPQYFVSELHPERFSPRFADCVEAIFETSRDPLTAETVRDLHALENTGELDGASAQKLLPQLVSCFARHHREASVREYQVLLAESAEMAWIATEGQAFNHITDRVEGIEEVTARQRGLGRPVKTAIEVSTSGRVRQSALRAATVERLLRSDDSPLPHFVTRRVPGSFLEFIERERLPDGRLDLAFDAQNAQGIFQMTQRRGGELGDEGHR